MVVSALGLSQTKSLRRTDGWRCLVLCRGGGGGGGGGESETAEGDDEVEEGEVIPWGAESEAPGVAENGAGDAGGVTSSSR